MNPPVRYFINARNVDSNSINLVEGVENRLNRVLRIADIIDYTFLPYQFTWNGEPQGVTCAYLFTSHRDDFIRRGSGIIAPSSKSLEQSLQEEIGHLTIHTWPEQEKQCSYTMDLSLQHEDRGIIDLIKAAFPGDYYIKKEHCGDITNVTDFSNGVGREVVGYFGQIGNKNFLSKMSPEEWIRKIAEEAKFKVVGTTYRETPRYLSIIAALSTSHMKIDYDKKNRSCSVDIYTCVDFIGDGKGNLIPINDEGDPELGMRIIMSYLKPRPHKDNYVISKPLAR